MTDSESYVAMVFPMGEPGAPPGPDNQGKASTCSLFAVVKAVCNGFDTSKFGKHGKLDFNQGEVKTALLTLTKDSYYDCLLQYFLREEVISNHPTF